jgi:hypothetical protein
MIGYLGLAGACILAKTSEERVSGILESKGSIEILSNARKYVLVNGGRSAVALDTFFDRFRDYIHKGLACSGRLGRYTRRTFGDMAVHGVYDDSDLCRSHIVCFERCEEGKLRGDEKDDDGFIQIQILNYFTTVSNNT